MDSLLTENRDRILKLARDHGAANVRVFGSAARDGLRDDSDVDILIDLEPGRGLLDQAALAEDLRDLLKRKVDVVEPDGIHWFIRQAVLEEAIPL